MNTSKHNTLSQHSSKKFLLCTLSGVFCIVIGATVLRDSSSNILEGIDLHLGRMTANIGVVLIFIKVIDAFFYKPLSEAINQRNDEIEEAYTQADQLRDQMIKIKDDYEKRLVGTEAKAKDQIQKHLKNTLQIKEDIIRESSQKAKEILDQAQEEIQNYRTNLVKDLKTQTIDLTLKATEKIILKNIDDEVNRNLIKEFIDQLEVKKI